MGRGIGALGALLWTLEAFGDLSVGVRPLNSAWPTSRTRFSQQRHVPLNESCFVQATTDLMRLGGAASGPLPTASQYAANYMPLIKPAPKNEPKFGERIDDNNDPQSLKVAQRDLEMRFDALPIQGDLSLRSWGPRGGDAGAYRTGGYLRPSPGQTQGPVTLYDRVFNRGQGFPASRYEQLAHDPLHCVHPSDGHCDSLAAAEALLRKPLKAVSFWVPENGQLNRVTFTPEDVRAIVAEAMMQVPKKMAGFPGRDPAPESVAIVDPLGPKHYRDVNPGTFRAVVSNYLGRQGLIPIIDTEAGSAVYNMPIWKYQIVSSTEVPAAMAQAMVTGRPGAYTANSLATSFRRERMTVQLPQENKTYDYILELGPKREIMGGEWLGASKTDHPDVVWAPRIEGLVTAPEAELNRMSGNPHVRFRDAMTLLKLSAGP